VFYIRVWDYKTARAFITVYHFGCFRTVRYTDAIITRFLYSQYVRARDSENYNARDIARPAVLRIREMTLFRVEHGVVPQRTISFHILLCN